MRTTRPLCEWCVCVDLKYYPLSLLSLLSLSARSDVRAACLYMFVSILLIFFNKATFSYYQFEAPNVLTFAQNIFSLICLILCKQYRYIEFHNFSLRNLRRLILLGLAFIAYMVFGMIAMKVVSIPMYTTLRRTTVVFVMILEYIISRKTSSLTIKVSVGLMILGALIAGVRDLNFDMVGYMIVVIYNLCTALYLVLINHISSQEKSRNGNSLLGSSSSSSSSLTLQKLDKYDFMFYNNLISIPMLLVIIIGTGETVHAIESPYWSHFGFILSLLASSSLAFAINYTIFWNTAVNSALTQTVSGQAKDVVVVLLGFILFDDAHFDPINMFGVIIGFGGSILYGMTKIIPTCTVEHGIGRFGMTLSRFGSTHRKKGDDRHQEDVENSLLPSRQTTNESTIASGGALDRDQLSYPLLPHRVSSHTNSSIHSHVPSSSLLLSPSSTPPVSSSAAYLNHTGENHAIRRTERDTTTYTQQQQQQQSATNR